MSSKVSVVNIKSEYSDINYGDLFEWKSGSDDQLKAGVLIYSYAGLISLSNPRFTWFNSQNVHSLTMSSLALGTLKKLPVSTKVIIEQE